MRNQITSRLKCIQIIHSLTTTEQMNTTRFTIIMSVVSIPIKLWSQTHNMG